MAGVGTVPIAAVWKALDECLPGHRLEEKTHNWWIYPKTGAPYRRFPLGGHGTRKKVRIEVGHVKKMARFFEVLDCVKSEIRGL